MDALFADVSNFEDEIFAMIAEEKSYSHKFAPHAVGNPVPIPRNYKEAVNDPVFGPQWSEAVHTEIRQLIANGTFPETKRPIGKNILTGRWVFDVKYTVNGGVERFKARLVARGFSQQYGEDYFNTFAPTMRADALRILLALIAMYDYEAIQVDVTNAFSLAKLKEIAYMRPVEGMEAYMEDSTNNVMKLEQSLYGLKQAAYEWYQLCRAELEKMGYKPLSADPCIFRKGRILVGVYVDDIIVAAPKMTDLDRFKQDFGQRFKTKDLGELNRILGMRITRDRADRAIYLDQEQYLEDVDKVSDASQVQV